MAILFTIVFIVETIWLHFFGADERLDKPLGTAMAAAIAAIWIAHFVLPQVTAHPYWYTLILGVCLFFIIPTIFEMEK